MVSRRGRRIAVVLVPGFKKKKTLVSCKRPSILAPFTPPATPSLYCPVWQTSLMHNSSVWQFCARCFQYSIWMPPKAIRSGFVSAALLSFWRCCCCCFYLPHFVFVFAFMLAYLLDRPPIFHARFSAFPSAYTTCCIIQTPRLGIEQNAW